MGEGNEEEPKRRWWEELLHLLLRRILLGKRATRTNTDKRNHGMAISLPLVINTIGRPLLKRKARLGFDPSFLREASFNAL